jgi:hypothetical protein
VCGPRIECERFKEDLIKHFNITDQGEIRKHLGVWYRRANDAEGPYFELSMEKFTEDMVKDFEMAIGETVPMTRTPGYPGQTLMKQSTFAPVMREEYRSFVGRAMWLVKKLVPEAANAARELAQHMENPGEEHWKAMRRLVGYLKSREKTAFKIRAPKELRVYAGSDSNYATNSDPTGTDSLARYNDLIHDGEQD